MSSDYPNTVLGALLVFSNGRTSPERQDSGLVGVFGSNGQIGLASVSNAPSKSIVIPVQGHVDRSSEVVLSALDSASPCQLPPDRRQQSHDDGPHPARALVGSQGRGSPCGVARSDGRLFRATACTEYRKQVANPNPCHPPRHPAPPPDLRPTALARRRGAGDHRLTLFKHSFKASSQIKECFSI
jgi:hypothetical protein